MGPHQDMLEALNVMVFDVEEPTTTAPGGSVQVYPVAFETGEILNVLFACPSDIEVGPLITPALPTEGTFTGFREIESVTDPHGPVPVTVQVIGDVTVDTTLVPVVVLSPVEGDQFQVVKVPVFVRDIGTPVPEHTLAVLPVR